MTPSRDTTDRKNSQPGYVYESDTVRRAYPANQGTTPSSPVVKMATAAAPPLLQSQQSVRAKDIPYHAREDSKPFTYGMVATNGHHHHHQENGSGGVANGATSSTPTSPSIHRRNWKESSSNMNNGQGQPKRLESPSLVRKFSNGSEQPVISPVRSAPRIPVPSIADPASPRPMRKLSESLLLNGGTGASSDNAASASAPNILPVATSSPRLDTSRNRSASSSASEMIKTPTPQLQHHISLEETIQDISTSPDSSRYVRFFLFLSPSSVGRCQVVRNSGPANKAVASIVSTQKRLIVWTREMDRVPPTSPFVCSFFACSRWKTRDPLDPALSSENRSVGLKQQKRRRKEVKEEEKLGLGAETKTKNKKNPRTVAERKRARELDENSGCCLLKDSAN